MVVSKFNIDLYDNHNEETLWVEYLKGYKSLLEDKNLLKESTENEMGTLELGWSYDPLISISDGGDFISKKRNRVSVEDFPFPFAVDMKLCWVKKGYADVILSELLYYNYYIVNSLIPIDLFVDVLDLSLKDVNDEVKDLFLSKVVDEFVPKYSDCIYEWSSIKYFSKDIEDVIHHWYNVYSIFNGRNVLKLELKKGTPLFYSYNKDKWVLYREDYEDFLDYLLDKLDIPIKYVYFIANNKDFKNIGYYSKKNADDSYTITIFFK